MEKLLQLGFRECQQNQGFGEHIGPFWEKNTDAGMLRALYLQAHHLNPEGVVNGGVLLAFADYVIYRAIGDDVGHQIKFATINLNAQFLAAAKPGQILYGRGKITRRTRAVIFAEGELYTEERAVMKATGIWKVIGA